MPTDEVWARDYLAKGFRMMAYGMDLMMMQQALARGISLMREQTGAAEAAR